MSVVATTDCAGEHFQESGSIEIVLAPPSTPPDTVVFLTRLTSGCSISTDVTVRNGQFPNWPWMTEGQTLDIELWHAGGPVRGGSPLWLTLKEPETGELYFTNHQSNWQLIELDLMPGILGFDVDLEGPQCEDLQGTQDFLYHQYNLRFHTPQSAAVLGGWQHGALVLPSGAQVRVQTHKAFVAYEHFLPPHPGVFDASRGPQAWFSAWKVQ